MSLEKSLQYVDRLPRWAPYAGAAAVTAATLLARLALDIGPVPALPIFLCPILLAGYFGGFGPALLATAIATVGADWFLLAPLHALGLESSENVLRVLWLVFAGLTIAVISGGFHRARLEASHARREADSALDRLRDNYLRFHTVFHQSPVAISISRASDGRIVEFNDALLAVHGVVRNDVTEGRVTVNDLSLSPEVLREVRELAIPGSGFRNREVTFRRAGCEPGTGILSVQSILLDGEAHHIGILTDVTEQRQLEREIKESEARLSVIFRKSPMGVSITRFSDGVIVDLNDAALRMVGLEAHDVIGRTTVDLGLRTPGGREAFVQELLARGRIGDVELSHLRGPADPVTILYSASLIEIGGERCILSTYIDISERKRLERAVHEYQHHLEQLVTERTRALGEAMSALTRSEERYRTLFTSSRTPMLLIDPESDEIVDANPSAVGFYGFELPALRGVRFSTLNATRGEDVLAESARAAREARQHLLLRHRLCDGEERDVEVHCGLVQIERRTLQFCIVHDITERLAFEYALRESEERHRLVMESAQEAIIIEDSDSRMLYGNPAALEATGYSLPELRGLHVSDLLSPEEHARHDEHRRAVRRGEHRLATWVVKRRDGRRRTFEFNTLQLPDRRVLSIGRDITERRAREQKLTLAASVFREAAEAIFITDRETRIVDVNEAFTAITGYSREDAVGRTPRLLHSGHQDTAFYERMWRTIHQAGHWQGEIWNRRKDGAMFACRSTITAVRDHEGEVTHFIALFSDITERRREIEAIEHQAHFDALTQLPNRLLLEDRMKQAFSRAKRQGSRAAVAFLDLDGFKPVNDEHGHKAGDHLLMEVARRLQACVRSHDTVARLGGDEFALLLTDLGPGEEWREVIERVLRAVAEPCPLPPGRWARVSASVGVTFYPGDEGTPDLLLRHADEAMYRAKRSNPGTMALYARDGAGQPQP